MELFGYKPDRSILQVHIAGFFRKKSKAEPSPKRRPANRSGGTTFVIVGRTHDPAIANALISPKKKAEDAGPGYLGYLWKKGNREGKAPHELIPLDFTPVQLRYPQQWKEHFRTKGYLIAMHVPSAFAARKNRLTRALYHQGKTADVKKDWNFIHELRKYGVEESVMAA